ncbi:hypothetical protein [Thiolapillus sp.]|uniref:hypothetical protein n=1 Tax=Thiolapillus sp. TaxID=2017437 RepID=UPI003AF99178
MNHMTYLMRDQVRDFVPSLGVPALPRKKSRNLKKLRPFLEVGAFVLAVLSYIAALSVMT